MTGSPLPEATDPGFASEQAPAERPLTIEPSVLSTQLGRSSGFGDYVRLAVLASALATVGAAFGGALERDAAAREAAYAYRAGSR